MVNFKDANLSDTSVENKMIQWLYSSFQKTWSKQNDGLSECARGNHVASRWLCVCEVLRPRHQRSQYRITIPGNLVTYPAGGAAAQRVERWTCDQQIVGSIPILGAKLRNNLGQVVHMHLCASVTKQYNLVPAKERWCSAAGKVTASLAESNDSLPPGGWLIVTCGLTACTPGSAPGPTLGNEYGKPLSTFTFIQAVDCGYPTLLVCCPSTVRYRATRVSTRGRPTSRVDKSDFVKWVSTSAHRRNSNNDNNNPSVACTPPRPPCQPYYFRCLLLSVLILVTVPSL